MVVSCISLILLLGFVVFAVNKMINSYFAVQKTIRDAQVALTLVIINRGDVYDKDTPNHSCSECRGNI